MRPNQAASTAGKRSAVSAAKKAAAVAAFDISIYSTTPWVGAFCTPKGEVDGIEVPDVAADLGVDAAFLAADTADVLSAAKAADGVFDSTNPKHGLGRIGPPHSSK